MLILYLPDGSIVGVASAVSQMCSLSIDRMPSVVSSFLRILFMMISIWFIFTDIIIGEVFASFWELMMYESRELLLEFENDPDGVSVNIEW